MNIDRQALIQLFLADSEEDLARLETGVLALEAKPHDPDAVGGIFRIAHTLKGNAAVLALDDFARLARALEHVLRDLRAQNGSISVDLATLVLRAVDALRTMLVSIRRGQPENPAQFRALEDELAAWGEGAKADRASPREAEAERQAEWDA
jgi:two-component system chemotaxis sensor kinase CheA